MITITECDGGYIAELDGYGFLGDGDTPEEAKKDLLEVLDDVAFFARQDGQVEAADKLISDIREIVK